MHHPNTPHVHIEQESRTSLRTELPPPAQTHRHHPYQGGGIYVASRRKPVTPDNVNEYPATATTPATAAAAA